MTLRIKFVKEKFLNGSSFVIISYMIIFISILNNHFSKILAFFSMLQHELDSLSQTSTPIFMYFNAYFISEFINYKKNDTFE